MNRPLEEEIRTWPRGLADIARLIGAKEAMVLGDAVGGVPTYIPKHPDALHPLTRHISLDALKKLAKAYGGQTIVIPRGVHKNLKKVAILDATGSRRAVALQLKCSERYVRKVANEVRPPDLFTVNKD